MENKSLAKIRNSLARNPTVHEALFRQKLIRWGFRFKFQKVINGYIADFVLPQFDLVIEIDGSNHYTQWGLVRDKMRDAVLKNAGYSVLHIRNLEVEDYKKEDLLQFSQQTIKQPEDRSVHLEYFRSLS
jgi:very-short-patch-repair endonuclease